MSDLYSRERVEDLGALYRQIAACNRMLKEAALAKLRYAELVNQMMDPATAEEGERLGEEALKLITVIDREPEVKRDLWRHKSDLYTRYGIQIGEEELKEAG